jgi:hypothetical protein
MNKFKSFLKGWVSSLEFDKSNSDSYSKSVKSKILYRRNQNNIKKDAEVVLSDFKKSYKNMNVG